VAATLSRCELTFRAVHPTAAREDRGARGHLRRGRPRRAAATGPAQRALPDRNAHMTSAWRGHGRLRRGLLATAEQALHQRRCRRAL